jgi:hypothetical protein
MTQQPTEALASAGGIDPASPVPRPAQAVDVAISASPEPVFARELSTYRVDRDGTALVAVHDASCCCLEPSWIDRLPAIALGGGVLASMVGVTALVACLPLNTLWMLGVVFVLVVGFAAMPARQTGAWAIAPNEIADRELRADYRALLTAQSELATALVRQRDSSPLARGLLDDSRDAVVACGRLAHATNPVLRYLADHSPASLDASVARLHDRATTCGDEATGQLRAATATARAHQRDLVDGMIVLRDHTRAELALAAARIEAATAEVVKLQTIDGLALARAAGAPCAYSAALRDTLDGLTAASAVLLVS